MADSGPPGLDAQQLRQAVRALGAAAPACAACAGVLCAGWESVSVPLAAPQVEWVGSLRNAADPEPTLQEHHPDGTHYWSPRAPIVLDAFPFNRCEVWRCVQCRRGFLQYTEAGGYYVDHRLREIDLALVTEGPPPTVA